MSGTERPPVGVLLSSDIEFRKDRKEPYRARVRWVDPTTNRRKSKSAHVNTPEAAQAWIDALSGLPVAASIPLAPR